MPTPWKRSPEELHKTYIANTEAFYKVAGRGLAQELDEDQIIVAQETEYTGAGKHIQPQLAFARQNGIELLFGDPATEVPGTNIVFPADPSLLKARDVDIDHMRTSLIRRQVSRAKGPLTEADIAYLMEETNSSRAFVENVLKNL